MQKLIIGLFIATLLAIWFNFYALNEKLDQQMADSVGWKENMAILKKIQGADAFKNYQKYQLELNLDAIEHPEKYSKPSTWLKQ